MVEPTNAHVVHLQDGRRMGYAQYGDPDGFVIVSAHGGLACRLDVAAADTAARDAGVRLISPDRPGIGWSDPQPGRTVLDWANDVTDVLDQLGVDRFAALGWSMGGQYAAAIGHALPHRVSRVAIVAGALPLTEPGVFAELPAIDRAYTVLSEWAPWVARQCFHTMGSAARWAPNTYGRLAARDLGPADGAVLRAEGFDTFASMAQEALRRPAGVVEEYRAWRRPWGFAPEDLAVAVDVWAGTDDELINAGWPHALADRIPGAQLRLRPGGHFMAHLHYREIFDALCA
ncbi:alpha/beta hydrolase [Mycobacterium antarcticum]|uniref:alpha/beta fold hydrolase n=1 Tax=unclassified Mycolicibacterium TaxID=2636767 RepID=UPI00239629E7|nr:MULTISPECIES: alpha/beta hydrolase [unclassified Mycolicibacterium]BDX32292.1 alpha/beta hydrolase [Mycolicibacterium sp. TUM20985]GLP75564.1 alpha/beta hydrolase [Mycolicibacterium sp. TUM20983]GLP84162.1 alpha/beta hydrolase [Mycolicibacterium sp. TUM20984]